MHIAKLAVAIVGLAALASLGSPVKANVLTFDDMTGNGQLNLYHGFTFDAPWTYYDDAQAPYNAHSGKERIYNNSTSATSFINFNGDIAFQGAWFAGSSGATASYSLYDVSNNLLASSGPLALTATPTFLASSYAGDNVYKLQFTGTNSHFVLDDLTFTPAVTATNVPEPGSVALLAGMGMTGMGLLARRRRQARKAA